MKDLIRQKWMGLAIFLFIAYCVYIVVVTAAPAANSKAARADDSRKCALHAAHWKEDVVAKMSSHLQDGAGQRIAAVKLATARIACESVSLDADVFRAYDQKIEAMAKQPDVVAEAQNILHK